MIRTFEGKKKLLFAPKAFLNSVARWLLNVRSNSGTTRISNTANPSAEEGPSIDIDAAETAKAIDQALAEKYPKSGDGRLLGQGLKWNAGKLGVDGEWLANEISKNRDATMNPISTPQATDNTEASTADDAEEPFEATFTDWSSKDEKILKLRCYLLITGSAGDHRFNPVDLVYSQSGSLISAKAVDDKTIMIGA